MCMNLFYHDYGRKQQFLLPYAIIHSISKERTLFLMQFLKGQFSHPGTKCILDKNVLRHLVSQQVLHASLGISLQFRYLGKPLSNRE